MRKGKNSEAILRANPKKQLMRKTQKQQSAISYQDLASSIPQSLT